MKLTKLETFLKSTCDLSTVDRMLFSNGEGVIVGAIDDRFIDYDNTLRSEVIDEVRENIGSLRSDLLPIYFGQVNSVIEEMLSETTCLYFPAGYLETVEEFYTKNIKEYMPDFDFSKSENIDVRQRKFYIHRKGIRERIIERLRQKIEEIQNKLSDGELVKIDYKGTTQLMAWLTELGIINLIAERCKIDNTYNFTKAAKVLRSFIDGDQDQDSLRKGIEAVIRPTDGNKKNHPLNSDDNKIFVEYLLREFKISK